jgi:membrane-associated phospholipid phosphatase
MKQGESVVPRSWHRQGVERLMHLWFFKATGTAAFMAIFFYSYFAVLHSPIGTVAVMPLTRFDDWVVFWPPAFYLYASLWVYTALVPALQPSLVKLLAYGCGIGSLCLSALVVFSFFPTAVPYEFSSWFTDPSLSLLRSLDMAGNACPSLHVATAIFTAMAMHKLLRDLQSPPWVRHASWLWCALIVYSTMAIKQHVFWDVLAGLLLGLVFGWLYSRLESWLVERRS